jgi:two-component system response regulator HupR/HoxA
MNSLQGTVLILSRAASDWRAGVAALCDEQGYRVFLARSETEAEAVLADVHVDIVIADEGPAEDESIPFLSKLRESSPDILRVLALGGKSGLSLGGIEGAGLYQLLRKPVDTRQLALTVRSGMALQELTRRHRLLAREPMRDCHRTQGLLFPGESRHFDGLVYVSEAMEKLCALAGQAAQTDLPILIQGEPGTGKELMARAVHYHSSRRAGPFIRKSCGSVTDAVLQADLFGAERKGAGEGGAGGGLLGMAGGGTLFLEDISEISRSLQIALLGWLQARENKPAAAEHEQSGSEPRLIVSSTQPLKVAVLGGKFRQDLYFRLRGVELEVPPLRDRREDIPVLACHFAARHSAALGRKILGVSAAALEKLSAYDFPGNVRELENEIRRMTALATDGTYLTTAIMSAAVLAAATRRGVEAGNGFAPRGETLKEKIESLEKHLVREALARHKWNRSRVAEELGLSRVGLANKIRRYGLNEQPPDSA